MCRMKRSLAVSGLWILSLAAACVSQRDAVLSTESCVVDLVVLGIAQDGGAPQIGNPDDRAWSDPSLRRHAASIGLIDHRVDARFLFEATPDMRAQLQMLDEYAPSAKPKPGLDAIFLTHAHIGHYAGLMFLGHESIGAKNVSVYAMPRMQRYLSSNGPWDQLVRYENIVVLPLAEGEGAAIGDGLVVTPYSVPHRDEYSETVGFVIESPDRSALFLPDIDDWDRWENEYDIRIEDMISPVDVAYLDATFFDNDEIPGRDMSGFPHPRIRDSMKRFSSLPEKDQRKVRFIHLNHTNPARYATSAATAEIAAAGFRVAEEKESFCLYTE